MVIGAAASLTSPASFPSSLSSSVDTSCYCSPNGGDGYCCGGFPCSCSSFSRASVVLCGGSARIPKLQQLIKDLFPTVELLNSISPDEVIPIGAAIEAGILLGRENLFLDSEILSVECSAKDILVKTVDESGTDKFMVALPSGTPLPARRQHILQAPGSDSSVFVEFYESLKHPPIKEDDRFAQIVLQDLDVKEGLHDILTVLTMKRDGSLHVTCTDQDTGKYEAITVDVAT